MRAFSPNGPPVSRPPVKKCPRAISPGLAGSGLGGAGGLDARPAGAAEESVRQRPGDEDQGIDHRLAMIEPAVVPDRLEDRKQGQNDARDDHEADPGGSEGNPER